MYVCIQSSNRPKRNLTDRIGDRTEFEFCHAKVLIGMCIPKTILGIRKKFSINKLQKQGNLR